MVFERLRSKPKRTQRYIEHVLRGQLTAARRLARAGVDPNEEFSLGSSGQWTAFAATLAEGPLDLVEALLKAGAHVNLRAEDRNALCVASRARLERRKKLKAVLAAGANVNMSVAPSKRTLLTLAALEGDETFARFLVEHGADVKRADYHGLTPHKLARMGGHDAIVELLERSGAPREAIRPADVEQVYLSERALRSQLHEIVKSTTAASHLSIVAMELEWPADDLTVVYGLVRDGRRSSLRLEILDDDRITLVWRDESGVARDLLAASAEVDGKSLRASLLLAFAGKPASEPPPQPGAPAATELSADLSPEALKATYRKLAKLYHPDVAGPESAEKMRELNVLYARFKSKG